LRLISNVCLFVFCVHKVIEFLYFIKVGYNLQDTIPTISDILKKKLPTAGLQVLMMLALEDWDGNMNLIWKDDNSLSICSKISRIKKKNAAKF
jgi:hypothetical protein